METLTNKHIEKALRSVKGENSALLNEAADRIVAKYPPPEPLTKLEQFAMANSSGLCANPALLKLFVSSGVPPEKQAGMIAKMAKTVALAQLSEKDT